MKIAFRAIVGAFLAVAAVASLKPALAADLGSPAADPDRVLGLSKFHPFSACNFALGAGMSYARLAAENSYTGFGSETGTGTLPLAADGVAIQLGSGCDMHFGRVVAGGYLNYTFGEVSTRIGDTSIALDRQWGFGGRLGYMATENMLLYGLMGMQYGNAKFTDSSGNMDQSLRGLRLGLGTEYKIAAPVWLRLEAAGVRYEKLDVSGVSFNPNVYTATASVVFKF
jgi:opacity protein-like surface antigen